MKNILLLLLCTSVIHFSNCQTKPKTESRKDVIEILILGTLHFNQFHNQKSEETNFAGHRRQQEFQEVVDKLNEFKPDAVFIEREHVIVVLQ